MPPRGVCVSKADDENDPRMCLGCQATGLDTTGRMYRRGGTNPNDPVDKPVITMWTGTRCPHCRGTGWLLGVPVDPPDDEDGGPWLADGTWRRPRLE